MSAYGQSRSRWEPGDCRDDETPTDATDYREPGMVRGWLRRLDYLIRRAADRGKKRTKRQEPTP